MVEFFGKREDGGVYSRGYPIERHGKGQGEDFPSFAAARSYADRDLSFGRAFVITHTPRGGRWRGHAGVPGETFEFAIA